MRTKVNQKHKTIQGKYPNLNQIEFQQTFCRFGCESIIKHNETTKIENK